MRLFQNRSVKREGYIQPARKAGGFVGGRYAGLLILGIVLALPPLALSQNGNEPPGGADGGGSSPAALNGADGGDSGTAAPNGADGGTSSRAPPSGAADTAKERNTAPQWTGAMPEDLLRPSRESAAVYPRDAVIGELGAGDAGDEPYRYAQTVLAALAAKKKASAYFKTLASDTVTEIFEKIDTVEPRKFRLGGGLIEPDGSFSFMYRFIGREKEVSGSVYIAGEHDEKLYLDDVLMEEAVETNSIKKSWDYKYIPYERFY